MSRIYFHAKDGEAEVSGCERANIGVMISDLACGVISRSVRGFRTDASILDLLGKDHYLRRSNNLESAFGAFMRVGHDETFRIGDEKITPFDLSLNTVMAIGNDVMKLCAVIHAQCEMHCYVLPENFEWFSAVISDGLEIGVFRENMGWDKVIELVKSTKDSPIVMSYSVCDSFPNRYVADWQDDCGGDDWCDLSYDDQWDMAIKRLLSDNYNVVSISSDCFKDCYFNSGLTAFDLVNFVDKKELDEV